MRKVIFSRQSEKIINKLIKKDPKLIGLILKKINELSIDPAPLTSKKLTNRTDYRVRVINYRIVYEYDDNFLYITVINKRDKVY